MLKAILMIFFIFPSIVIGNEKNLLSDILPKPTVEEKEKIYNLFVKTRYILSAVFHIKNIQQFEELDNKKLLAYQSKAEFNTKNKKLIHDIKNLKLNAQSLPSNYLKVALFNIENCAVYIQPAISYCYEALEELKDFWWSWNNLDTYDVFLTRHNYEWQGFPKIEQLKAFNN